MTERAPVDVTDLDRYGNPELPESRPRDLLEAGPPRPEITFLLLHHPHRLRVASAEPYGATRWRFGERQPHRPGA